MGQKSRAVVVLATNNTGKVREFARLLGDELPIEFRTVAACTGDEFHVNETGESFRENAELKARAASALTGRVALADDSGLEVDALGAAPGIRSARYAGEHASDRENNAELLTALGGVGNRRARFVCVLALVDPRSGALCFSEGICAGVIGQCERGEGGFGYDPIFLPDGFEGRSFAELTPAEKDGVSHRGRALSGLRDALRALDPEH